jgi:hypothetical protein
MSDVARFLRRYSGMRIVDVRDNAGGIVIEVGPIGHMSRRRLLLVDVKSASEIEAVREPDDDDLSGDDDAIADEYHERSRYEEDD